MKRGVVNIAIEVVLVAAPPDQFCWPLVEFEIRWCTRQLELELRFTALGGYASGGRFSPIWLVLIVVDSV
jgi:hypothetical protein